MAKIQNLQDQDLDIPVDLPHIIDDAQYMSTNISSLIIQNTELIKLLIFLFALVGEISLWIVIAIKIYKHRHYWKRIVLLLTSLVIITFGLITFSLWPILALDGICGPRYEIFHAFNQHLLDVCLSSNSSECPKNETELKSFNETEYIKLQQCFKTKYRFDQKTGKYAWIVRKNGANFVFVSHPDFPKGFEGFAIGHQDELYNPPNWPPQIEGDWQLPN